MPEDEVERVITAAIGSYVKGAPAELVRGILEGLWEAGYEVTCRLDVIPIRRNPGPQ